MWEDIVKKDGNAGMADTWKGGYLGRTRRHEVVLCTNIMIIDVSKCDMLHSNRKNNASSLVAHHT